MSSTERDPGQPRGEGLERGERGGGTYEETRAPEGVGNPQPGGPPAEEADEHNRRQGGQTESQGGGTRSSGSQGRTP